MIDKDWSSYEKEVFGCIKDNYPKADVKFDVRLKGRYSKRLRQIDVLITENCPFGLSQIIVDAKLHKRKLDVKAVEQFEGLVDDVGAEKGLLISNKGYSKSALRRAYNCPSDLELDILDFSELQRWQAFGALPYAGDYAFLVPAPFGWVIDISNVEDCLCNMFQRGIDIDTARKNKEFLYINFWNRKKDNLTAEELDAVQTNSMSSSGLKFRVSYLDPIIRKDAKTRIRSIEVLDYKGLEVTGFLEFKDIIFFAVLLTPVETKKQNIRRLMHVMQSAIPLRIKKDNSLLIDKLKKELSISKSCEDKARILLDIGHWYRDMAKLNKARYYLEESVAVLPNYYSIKELIHVLISLEETKKVVKLVDDLLRLDLANPTVFNDAIEFSHTANIDDEVIKILLKLSDSQKSESLEKANCLFYCSHLLYATNIISAKIMLNESRGIYRKVFPEKHKVFKLIKLLNKQIKKIEKK